MVWDREGKEHPGWPGVQGNENRWPCELTYSRGPKTRDGCLPSMRRSGNRGNGLRCYNSFNNTNNRRKLRMVAWVHIGFPSSQNPVNDHPDIFKKQNDKHWANLWPGPSKEVSTDFLKRKEKRGFWRTKKKQCKQYQTCYRQSSQQGHRERKGNWRQTPGIKSPRKEELHPSAATFSSSAPIICTPMEDKIWEKNEIKKTNLESPLTNELESLKKQNLCEKKNVWFFFLKGKH